MDGYQFTSSLVGSLAWPAAVVWLAYLLKRPLAKLIPRVRTLKYGTFQVDISEKLEEAKELVFAEVSASVEESHEAEDRPVAFHSIAEVDPRAAIFIAWRPLEVELAELAAKVGVKLPPGRSTRKLLERLEKEGLLNDHLVEQIAKLQTIRNAAATVTDDSLSFEIATDMEQLCSLITAQLKIINASTAEQTQR